MNRPVMSFIEVLTLRVWVGSVLPHLLWRRLWRRSIGDRGCYAIDASPVALAVARACRWVTGVPVERLQFRLMEIVDEEGVLLRLRIAYQDLAEVQTDALKDPAFRTVVEEYQAQERMVTYLGKAISSVSLSQRQTLWRALLTIQVCRWKVKREPDPTPDAIFFLQRRPWMRAIASYAIKQGVLTVPVGVTFDVKAWLDRMLPPELRVALQWIRSQWYQRVVLRPPLEALNRLPRLINQDRAPRLAVEYYGHLNLDQPARYSDVFFWQQSQLPAADVLMVFNVSTDPLNEQKWTELKRHGFSAVALDPRATTRREVPILTQRPQFRHHGYRPPRQRGPTSKSREAQWLRQQAQDYLVLRQRWEALFTAAGVKVYVSWFKYNGVHCAIADALQRVGGILAMYQRAYEDHPSVETTMAADVVFGFSPAVAEIERRSHSIIPYHVTTGYLGDHRFSLLRAEAQRVRQLLQGHGARKILAFFDENSGEDSRWHTGHELQREHYAFLLERLLARPTLGLVIKPKVPSTLRRRLGPVAALLQRAEATGRCVLYEGGALHSSHPPVEAALAADLAVHSHLCAATAGLESALAGVPTLLLDREGWARSPLYRLGVGRVVFTEWQALWDACLEHWERPGGIPGFGDWSSMLDEFDPFRDGRAAERMGTYLSWLLEGLRAGRDRETVMANAAERYGALWGKDKVTQINWSKALEVPDGLATTASMAEAAGV